jgi:hypothetical protein
MNNKKYDKMISLVRERQDDPISIRELAIKLRVGQKDILEECEAEGLNINIGFMIEGAGHALHDRIGDYSIEDLSYDIYKVTTGKVEK